MRRTTVLGRSFHFAKNTRFLEKTSNPEPLQHFLEEQSWDQSLKFRSCKFLTNMDLKLQLHHSSDRQRTSYVMISRGMSRFMDEVHIPSAELRSSAELLSDLQIAEEGKSCQGQSKTSIQETGAAHVSS